MKVTPEEVEHLARRAGVTLTGIDRQVLAVHLTQLRRYFQMLVHGTDPVPPHAERSPEPERQEQRA